MSVVTNIILTTGCPEDEDPGIRWLNGKLEAIGQIGRQFTSVDSKPDMRYAGTKALECEIYLGAFNYLDLDAFVRLVKQAPWEDPEEVQLFVKREDDNRFEEINIAQKGD